MYHIHECFNEIQAIRDHHAGFSGSLNGKVYKLWRNGGRELVHVLFIVESFFTSIQASNPKSFICLSHLEQLVSIDAKASPASINLSMPNMLLVRPPVGPCIKSALNEGNEVGKPLTPTSRDDLGTRGTDCIDGMGLPNNFPASAHSRSSCIHPTQQILSFCYDFKQKILYKNLFF